MSYLYNGILLPNIEDVWVDKEAHTHAYILAEDINVNGYVLVLYDREIKVSAGGRYSFIYASAYKFADNAWTTISGAFGGVIIWSNADVYYADDVADVGGTIYLAASDPIPASAFPADFDPRSFAYGMRVGAVIRSLRSRAVKEYTHYSYNGVVLPKLPEWDKTKYPYVALNVEFENDGSVDYAILYLFDRVDYFTKVVSSTFSYWAFSLPNGYKQYWYNAWNGATDWDLPKDQTATSVAVSAFTQHSGWANFDILNENGTVAIAASDPIPVEVS